MANGSSNNRPGDRQKYIARDGKWHMTKDLPGDRQTFRQADRETTDKSADQHTDKQINQHTDQQTDTKSQNSYK